MSNFYPNPPVQPQGDYRYQAPGYPYPATNPVTNLVATQPYPGYAPPAQPVPGAAATAPQFTSAAQAAATAAQAAATDAAVNDFLNQASNRNSGNYVDNILNQNAGKLCKLHFTFNSGTQTGETKVFTGILEAVGRDHIVISDPKTGHRFVLLMIYFDYAEFPEEINYYYPGTNRLNVATSDFLQNNPEIMPLYNYKAAKQNAFIQHLEAKVGQ
ncbi:MAG: spore coat protein GerQ [Turicibacter sp.]|nr:spore coat protein GerQ [Turicibacter sp.]